MVDSVRIRCISDVPLGVMLSGGVDSSLVAAIAQKINSQQIKTFSISFEEDRYDESKYANAVSNLLKTEHYEYRCTFSEVIDFIKHFEDYYDEPIFDPSCIPTLLLCKKTKQDVTVALSGDGGDELFAGYERYKWMQQASFIYMLPDFARKVASIILKTLPNYKLKLISKGILEDDVYNLYIKMVGSLKKDLLTENYNFGSVNNFWAKKNNLIENISRFDIKTYLNNNINTKVDRAASRFSLETRAPLMDFRVAEFALNIPVKYKYTYQVQKKILKDTLYQYLPEEMFKRKKSGFAMPLKEWFKSDLKEMAYETLTKSNIDNSLPFLEYTQVEKILHEHMSGKWNHSIELWKLIVWIKIKHKYDHFNF